MFKGLRFGSRRSMKLQQRLLLIVAVAAVPTVVLLGANFLKQTNDASAAQNEKNGIEYVLVTQKLLHDVQTHRGLAALAAVGGTVDSAQLQQKTDDIDADTVALQAVDKKFGKTFTTSNRVASIKQKWDGLKSSGKVYAVADSNTRHTNLIAGEIIPLIYQVGDASHLLNDPTDTGSHASQALVKDVPRTSEALGEVRENGLVAYSYPTGTALPATVQSLIVGTIRDVQISTASFDQEITALIADDKKLEGKLRPLISNSDDGTTKLLGSIQTSVLGGPSTSKLTPNQYYDEASRAVDGQFAVSTALSRELRDELNLRVSDTNASRIISMAASLLGIGVAGLMIFFVGRGITRRIARLVAAADRISLGEINSQVDVHGDDEIGELAESFERMQSSLQAAIDRLRTRRAS